MKKIVLPAILLLLAATPAIPTATVAATVRTEKISGSAETEGDILAAINRIRAEHGLNKLRKSEKLTTIAREHSRDMAGSGVLGHRDSGGRDLGARIAAARVKGWRLIGENVGRSSGHRSNAEAIVSVWMESAPHRKNILNRDFDFTGIGTASAKDGTLFATQLFLGSTDGSPDTN